jgi:hypothetical protein
VFGSKNVHKHDRVLIGKKQDKARRRSGKCRITPPIPSLDT